MSYILDALKKAEQERQRGSAPDLLATQTVPEEKPRNRFPLRYFIFLFVAVVTIASVWGLSRLVSIDKSSPAPDIRKEVRGPAVPPVAVPDRAVTAAKDNKTAVVTEIDTKRGINTQTVRGNDASVTTEIIKDRSVSGPAVEGQDRQQERPRNPESKQPAVQKNDLPQTRVEKSSTVPDPVKSASGKTETQSKMATEQRLSSERVYSLKDLPESMKKELPEFSFSAFLYSENPASRMVRINDRMLKEGQELVPGLRLKEITPDGVIFLHKEVRFLISMKQGAEGR